MGDEVLAYSDTLKINRLLLIKSISSRRNDIAIWDYNDKRGLDTLDLDWSGQFDDGADTKASGYVIYDPLCDLDKRIFFNKARERRNYEVTMIGY